MNSTRIAKLAAAAVGLALVVVAVGHFELAAYLAPSRIEAMLEAAGPLAPVVLIGTMAVAVIVSPLPSLPIDVAAGAFFGPWLGTLYAAIGATLGSVIAFGIARFLGRGTIERVLGGHISFCRECSDHLLTRVVFASRLIPVVSFDLVSYGAGLTNIGPGRFALATFTGMLPLTFIYTSSGPFLVSGNALAIVLGLIMVVLFLTLPLLIERYDPFGMSRLFSHGDDPGPEEPRASKAPDQ